MQHGYVPIHTDKSKNKMQIITYCVFRASFLRFPKHLVKLLIWSLQILAEVNVTICIHRWAEAESLAPMITQLIDATLVLLGFCVLNRHTLFRKSVKWHLKFKWGFLYSSNYYSFYVIQLETTPRKNKVFLNGCLHIIHSIFHNI